MRKTLSYYIDLSLMTEGLFFLPSLIFDRLFFQIFFRHYYKHKFRHYGRNVYWGKHFSRKIIPRSVRISNPQLISIGNNCQIDEGVYLQANASGEGIFIAEGTRINAHTHILAGDAIFLERKVLVAPFVLISSLNHRFDATQAVMDQPMKNSGKITIGEGTWIGQQVVILGGASVAPKTVVAAKALVKSAHGISGVLAGAPATMVKRHE